MNTLAWLFILTGLLLIRQVSKGRVMNLGEDLSDATLAFLRGDTDELGNVLARKGESAAPTAADLAAYKLTEGTTGAITGASEAIAGGLGNSIAGIQLATAAVALGEKAKGYRWAATGPDYYDCSGLIWRAAQAAGYKGSRFSTADVDKRKGFVKVSTPATQGPGVTNAGPGDIVLWKAGNGGVTGHMGVVTGRDTFYSARSVRSGIGEAKISTFRKTRPSMYLRYQPNG